MIDNFSKTVNKNHQGSSLLSPAHGRAGARATLLSFYSLVPPPSEKIAGGFQQAGKKKKGCGENEFLPACLVWGWESVSAIPALAGRQNRKFFVSLIEKNLGGRRLKNVKKIFLFCSPSGERKRWAGQSAKSSGFCSKKVLTSSSRHHHIELVASLGASRLASAGRFARKLKGFLKSIKSFCWLIWRFANLKSLLVLKNKSRFFLSPKAKSKARFY